MKNGDFADKNEYSIGLSWGYVFLQVFPEANSGRVGSSSFYAGNSICMDQKKTLHDTEFPI